LDQGLEAVIAIDGKSDRNQYRAVMYYLLTKHFRKVAVYKQAACIAEKQIRR
jgi:hypothetical protein